MCRAAPRRDSHCWTSDKAANEPRTSFSLCLHLFPSLPSSFSLCLFFCLSCSLFLFLCLNLHLSVSISVSLSPSVSVNLCISLFLPYLCAHKDLFTPQNWISGPTFTQQTFINYLLLFKHSKDLTRWLSWGTVIKSSSLMWTVRHGHHHNSTQKVCTAALTITHTFSSPQYHCHCPHCPTEQTEAETTCYSCKVQPANQLVTVY